MKVILSIPEMREAHRMMTGPVGLVPTMGYLHEGHLSLVRQSIKDCASTVVSIFVNPSQFGPGEDFEKYPRDERHDLVMLEQAGVDVVFMPTPEEIYPAGYDTWVEVGGITERLEGAVRPGHFRGVATVCNKLFNIVQPSSAYFGQKDAQQVLVIQKMVAELNMNLEVVVMPTVREPDGLAMSSRNSYLNPDERRAATVLYRSLTLAKKMHCKGERDAEAIRSAMTSLIQAEPLACIDYISMADTATLEETDRLNGRVLVSLAMKIGKTRLIDNIVLG
jgi:pantoate--beta-alanine ligase